MDRKYMIRFITYSVSFLSIFMFGACATNQQKANIQSEAEVARAEPQFMESQNGSDWLNEVGTEVRAFASKQSRSRTLASPKSESLFSVNRWQVLYDGATNRLIARAGGKDLALAQTKISEINELEFVAQGQKNPLVLAVSVPSERLPASEVGCRAKITYWNSKRKAYNQRTRKLRKSVCARVFRKIRGL